VSLLEQLLLYRRLSAHRSAAAVTSSWLLSLRCSKPPTSKLIRIGVHRRLRFLSQPRLKFCNSLAIYVSITPMSKLNQDLQRRYHIGPLWWFAQLQSDYGCLISCSGRTENGWPSHTATQNLRRMTGLESSLLLISSIKWSTYLCFSRLMHFLSLKWKLVWNFCILFPWICQRFHLSIREPMGGGPSFMHSSY
jgi:hypothetical protein